MDEIKDKTAAPAKGEKSAAVKECEERYPETTNDYKKILGEQYEVFVRKQLDYGPDNISVGSKLSTSDEIKVSLTGIWFRVNDKIMRLKQLVLLGKQDHVGESIQDTFVDLSVYGIIAQIVIRGKWGK